MTAVATEGFTFELRRSLDHLTYQNETRWSAASTDAREIIQWPPSTITSAARDIERRRYDTVSEAALEKLRFEVAELEAMYATTELADEKRAGATFAH